MDFTNVMRDKAAYFDHNEVKLMLDKCIELGKYRDYMLIQTLYKTGRRITEVVGEKPWTCKVGLRPMDIREDGLIEWDILKKNHIKSKTKTGLTKAPHVVLKARLNKKPVRKLKIVDDDYHDLISEYIEENQIPRHQRVFPITSRRALAIVKEVAEKCSITRENCGIHCHMFRHTLAVKLLKDHPNNAAMLRHVQDILDHSNIQMTMTYAQFTQEDKRELLNKSFKGDI